MKTAPVISQAKNPVEGKVSSCCGACSSLIKMHHQISTRSQTLNETSSPGTVVGHSATHPTRWKDKVLRGGSTWKQAPMGGGYSKPLWCCNNAKTPHSQPAGWMVGCPAAAPAGATSRLQTLLWRASGKICEKKRHRQNILSAHLYSTRKILTFTAVRHFKENAVVS